MRRLRLLLSLKSLEQSLQEHNADHISHLRLQICQPSKQFCEVGFCRRQVLQTVIWIFDSKMFLVHHEDQKHVLKRCLWTTISHHYEITEHYWMHPTHCKVLKIGGCLKFLSPSLRCYTCR